MLIQRLGARAGAERTREVAVQLTITELTLTALVVATLAACGPTDDTEPTDAAATDAASTGPATPPDIPWLTTGTPPIVAPRFDACPAGWTSVTDGDLTHCDPYPAGGALDCPTGQAHFPGEPTCADVGAPCPGGDFPIDLPPDTNIVYVQPGAVGGDGSLTSPYGGFGELSFGGLPRASVIALSRGTHDGPVRLTRNHVLQGACAAATTVRTAIPDATAAVINFVGEGSTRDLTIGPSPRPGIRAAGTGVVGEALGVVVSEAAHEGVIVGTNAQVRLESSVVRDTTPVGSFNRGLAVATDSSADVTRTIVERNVEIALFGNGPGATMTLADVVVRDTRSRAADGDFGRGVSLEGGASVDATRTLVERSQSTGVFLDGGSSVRLVDVVIRDSAGRASDGLFGRGLAMQGGSTGEVTRVVLDRNHDSGVFVSGASATLADVVVRDTSTDGAGLEGRGLSVNPNSTVEWTRALLARNHDVGAFVSGPDTTVALTDVSIVDTAGEDSGRNGRGLGTRSDAAVTVTRGLFERNHLVAVFGGDGASLSLTDVAARDTRTEASSQTLGRGVGLQGGATARMNQALVERSIEIGVFATGEATMLDLSDVVIRDTASQMVDGRFGRGLDVQLGATAAVSRTVVERSRDAGVFVFGGGTATLTDVVVADVQPQACAEASCAGEDAGHGIGSYDPGTAITISQFVVRGAALCGLHVALEADLAARSGEVRQSAIGACLQVDGFDVGRVSTEVRYEDNDVNLQVTSLPVPAPSADIPPD